MRFVGPVVDDLVVVERDHPGRGRVRRLEIRVHLVRRVADAVLVEGDRLLGHPGLVRVRPDATVDTELVDVVAEEEHHVVVALGHVGVRRVPALPPRLAGRERQRHLGYDDIGRGSGPGPADRAELAIHAEAVPVVPPRTQPAYVDVHRVTRLRPGLGRSLADDPAEPVVLGDLPFDLDRAALHPAERRQRVRGEPGPDHHRVRQRIAGRDAEGERIPAVRAAGRPGQRLSHVGQVAGQRQRGRRPGDRQKASSSTTYTHAHRHQPTRSSEAITSPTGRFPPV